MRIHYPTLSKATSKMTSVMKFFPQHISVIAIILFCNLFLINTELKAQTITIGNGTVVNGNTAYPAPYGNWYWGARHQFLILASDLTAAGFPSPADITELAFDVVSPNGVALTNFEIKIGNTTASAITTWQSGLTSVYLAPSYTEVTGWNSHAFSSAFTWNGVDNLVIETCFNNSSFTNNATVNQTTTSYVSSLYYRADATGVCANTTTTGNATQRPNMQFLVAATAPPLCAINMAPANGATDFCPIGANLSWAPDTAGGGPAFYQLYFGSDGGGLVAPTNIINGTNIGNVTSWTYASNLMNNTTYYWQIIPTNSMGTPTGCPIFSFTTGTAPTIGSTSASANGICPGSTVDLMVSAYNGTLQWQYFDISGWINIGPTNTNPLTVTPTQTTLYQAIVSNSACASIPSFPPIAIITTTAAMGGTATVTNDSICNLTPTTLELSGSNGSVQWQSSTDGGVTWINETGTGSTTTSYTVNPLTDIMYQAVLASSPCPNDTSNTVSVSVLMVQSPTGVDGSRCGIGPVTLSASGNGILSWYASQTGGLPLDTGVTYTPSVLTTTTYYVTSTVGGSSTPPMVTVGTGTLVNTGTTYPAPYGNWYWGARNQFLIRASELNALGITSSVNITSLAFDVATIQGVALTNFEIKLGNTNDTALTTWQSGLTSVFVAPTYTETAGWNTHTFSMPFIWNGVGNIVVETCFNNSSFTNNAIVRQTATPFVSSRYYRADASGVCANTGVTGTASQRPNMQLAISGGGCASPRTPVQAIVNAAPAVTITASSVSLCQGDPSNMTVASSNPAYTYTWSPATDLNTTIGITVIATPQVPRWYYVIGDDGSCANIDSIFIDVGPPAVSGVAITPVDTICSGISLLLSLSGQSGNIQWQSSTNGGTTWANETGTGATTAQFLVTPLINTAFQAVLSSAGCPNDTTNVLNIVPLNVTNPTTLGDIRCDTGIVNLSAMGAGNFYWYLTPAGGNPVFNGLNYSPSLTQTTTYYVQSILGGDFFKVGPDNNGFGNQGTVTTANWGMTFDVNAVSTLDRVFVYPWKTGPITINLKDASGITLNTITKNVVQFTGKTPIDLGFALTPGTGYRLELATGSVDLGRNTSGATYPYASPGSPATITGYFNPNPGTAATNYLFFYDWLVSTGCKSARVPVTGEINATPAKPTISQIGNVLVSSSTVYNQWYFAGAAIAGATNQNYTPTQSGFYYVLLNNNGCMNQSDSLFFVFVGIDDPEYIQLELFPNPSSGMFNLKFAAYDGNDVSVIVRNVIGSKVYEQRIPNFYGNYSETLDLSALREGIYVVKVSVGAQDYHRKMIIVR